MSPSSELLEAVVGAEAGGQSKRRAAGYVGHGPYGLRTRPCDDALWVLGRARPSEAPVMTTGSPASLPQAVTKRFRSNGSFRLIM